MYSHIFSNIDLSYFNCHRKKQILLPEHLKKGKKNVLKHCIQPGLRGFNSNKALVSKASVEPPEALLAQARSGGPRASRHVSRCSGCKRDKAGGVPHL